MNMFGNTIPGKRTIRRSNIFECEALLYWCLTRDKIRHQSLFMQWCVFKPVYTFVIEIISYQYLGIINKIHIFIVILLHLFFSLLFDNIFHDNHFYAFYIKKSNINFFFETHNSNFVLFLSFQK